MLFYTGRYQVLGQIHHHIVIRTGLIDFHHGELGIMPPAESFVAEIPVDFKNLFHSADEQPLEKQLG